MRTLLSLLLLSAVSCFGQLTNLTFYWDLSIYATGYRLYEMQGTNRIFLGTTDKLTFTVTNWNVSTSRVMAVTSTNMLGESAITNTLTVPPAPLPVQNLKPLPLSIVSPVPGVIELSHDLADWTQRLRFSTGPTSASVMVTWIQQPKEPVMFMRSREPTLSFPPLP